MTDPRFPPRIQAPTGAFSLEQAELARALGYQYDLGCTATRRMLTLNTRHAEHAWQRRRRDPIAAYALALLFADINPRFVTPTGPALSGDDWSGALEVKAASRVWIAGPENQDLPDMLYRLECQVSENRLADGWALREQLTTSVDNGLSADAVWVGVGVSSLDTPTGTWAQTGDLALNEAYVPGTIRLLLNIAPPGLNPEHAWIVAERRGLGDYNTTTIHSTHRLSDLDFSAPFTYGYTQPADLVANAWHAPILHRMYGLDAALRAARHFAAPIGRPAKDTLWRHATTQPKPRWPA